MQTYLVGGAVRDHLLGLPVQDRDWVVVGATPEQMVAQGYLPVGRDFPVFLHPHTHEEYALARTERKSGSGYRGFVVHADPGVTLEEDLARRDLSINAMAAQEMPDGSGLPDLRTLVDPCGGQRDLSARLLRHASPSFTEDPVRILRLARFAARFTRFEVAPGTQTLLHDMVHSGEAAHLVPERVWQEMAKGLMQSRPSRMFAVLRGCGALAVVCPEVDALWGVPQPPEHHPEIDTGVHVMMVLDAAASAQAALEVRFACLVHDLGKATTPRTDWPRHIGHEARSVKLIKQLCLRLRVPRDCTELAEVVAREHGNIHRSATLDAAATVRLLERCDAFRKPERFAQMVQACECDARGRLGKEETAYPQGARLLRALELARAVATEHIAAVAVQTGARGPAIGHAVAQARAQALHALEDC
ncbi:MAG: multifunctional CCA addition/repair protein [Rhodoferax sp.]